MCKDLIEVLREAREILEIILELSEGERWTIHLEEQETSKIRKVLFRINLVRQLRDRGLSFEGTEHEDLCRRLGARDDEVKMIAVTKMAKQGFSVWQTNNATIVKCWCAYNERSIKSALRRQKVGRMIDGVMEDMKDWMVKMLF